jgi:hypothetical protein
MTARRMLECAACFTPVRIDKGMAHHSWPDPFDEPARPDADVHTHIAVINRTLMCAVCANGVNVIGGRAYHVEKAAEGEDWEPHEVRVTCPCCGRFLKGPPGVETASLDYAPYHVAGVAFYIDRACRGVWHRFSLAQEGRMRVEQFFRDQGGPADGSRYRHPVAESASKLPNAQAG